MKFIIFALAILSVITSPVQASTFPLSENRWDNPDFVKRFLGTYGFDLYTEPSISIEERQFIDRLSPLLEDEPELAKQKLLPRTKPADNAIYEFYLGQLYFRDGQHEQAILAYRSAIKKHPAFARAYRNLGLIYVMENRCDEAQPMLLKVSELGRADGNIYGLLAYCSLNQSRWGQALQLYRLASALQPQNKDWRSGTVQALLSLDRPQEAADVLASLLKDAPRNTEYLMLNVQINIQLQEWVSAAACLELLNQIEGLDAEHSVLLGDMYIQLEMPTQAGKSYQASLDHSNKPSFGAMEQRFHALSQTGDIEEAQALLSLILLNYSESLNSESKLKLVWLEALGDYQNQGYQQCLNGLSDILRISPMDAEALLLAGKCAYELEQWHQAKLFFQRAQALEEVSYRAYLGIAQVYAAQHKLSSALSALQSAQAIEPSEELERKIEIVRSAIIE